MNKIDIKNDSELTKLFDALADDIVRAHAYYKLYSDLLKDSTTHSDVFNESNTFWTLTSDSLREASILRVCRVYDRKGLSLERLIKTVQAYKQYFSKANFKNRLSNNIYKDSLAEFDRLPKDQDIEKDLALISKNNKLVKKLIDYRNDSFAHRNVDLILRPKHDFEPISYPEFEHLLKNSLTIYNKYSELFRASTNLASFIGQDDYTGLLKFASLGLKKHEEDIEKEIAQYTKA
jgi:hypothetical protein